MLGNWRAPSGMPRRSLRRSLTALSFWKLEKAERRVEVVSGGENLNGMGLWFANCWFSLIAHSDCQLKITN